MVIKFAHVFNVTDQSGTFRPAYRAMLSASPTAPAQRPLTRAEKNRIWSSCSGAATLPARASLFGTKIEAAHGIKGAKHD
jgi:hypothetical protein